VKFVFSTTRNILFAGVCAAAVSGCMDRTLAPLNPCLVSGVTRTINVTNVDKVDLLFMVDNSTSMKDKQTNLRLRVPQLVQTLVTGMRSANDPNPFPPVTDMHIAVVDSDMGLPGVTGIPGCVGFGDDGLFRHTPHPSAENPNCDASYPAFLSYAANSAASASAVKIAQDFGCIANVGTGGCGFEQQLESTLKALWPSADAQFTFLAETNSPERLGHGDLENTGFLRNDPSKGLSLLAIIELSDEDDGSTGEMQLYTPRSGLPANTWVVPSTIDDLNLRPLIGTNRDHLFKTTRYIESFKALRKDSPNLVVFAAITGVPVDLVDSNATTGVDFTDGAQRDAFYDRMLNDSRMQHVPDSEPTPRKFEVPACDTAFGKGYPGRRYVEVAKGMGENATIYSICESDYTPAMNNIIDIIAKQLRDVCLPRPLVRTATGTVSCNVVWELPTAAMRSSNETPIQCSERAFLAAPGADHAQTSSAGGAICTVNQLPVTNNKPASGDGWYYDNFSDDIKRSCDPKTPQRVSFTVAARPPTGVTVKLECLNETQLVADNRTDVIPGPSGLIASIGTSCETTTSDGGVAANPDDKCLIYHTDGSVEHSMFCHPDTNTCVRGCSSQNDCPPAWVCDTRPETLAATMSTSRPQGGAFCVNPTCGAN
jgi:hypothetical protein